MSGLPSIADIERTFAHHFWAFVKKSANDFNAQELESCVSIAGTIVRNQGKCCP